MGEYFLLANLDKKEFVNPHKFKCGPEEEGFGAKLHEVCANRLGGALIFLAASSQYLAYMGTWAGDRIAVVGDQHFEDIISYEEIRVEWKDISEGVAISFFDFVEE